MARSRELWLWSGASLVAAAAALGGVAGALAAARPGYRLWSAPPMVGAYVACALVLACLWAAVRDWRFPFAADKSGRVSGALAWAGPPTVGWVDRVELAVVVSALTDAGSGAVALTTGLVGAGGFGKTMLAARACQDRVVRRRFPGGVCWVTVGRDLNGEGLAQRISEAVWNLGGEGATFTSVEEAGRALAGALAARRRTLLVADDIWTSSQLVPFVMAGQAGRLLVTTRRPAVLAGAGARQVEVDAVRREVAGRILAQGVPPMAGLAEENLLSLAGGWPLLLSLINGRLAEDLARGRDIDVAARGIAERLRRDGPAALDIKDADSRQLAVAATINYSLDTLDATDRDWFCQLGIFAEDAEIPLPLIMTLWGVTGTMSQADAAALCERLGGLSLVSLTWAGNTMVMVIHDVVRDFARSTLGAEQIVELNGVLLAAVAASISVATPIGAQDGGSTAAWWELDTGDGYLRGQLIWHLIEAGRGTEAEVLACDLRWAGERLAESGPAAVAADLALVGTRRAARMAAAVIRVAHLLAPAEPIGAVVDILHSRLAVDPDWGPQVTALKDAYHRFRLVNRWPLPDLPNPALRLVIVSGDRRVSALAVAPDGNWLATGSSNGMVRIWDAATGQAKVAFAGHRGAVIAVAIAPDGKWLATSGRDKKARIWDPATGKEQAAIASNDVAGVAISPDGSWLATGSGRRVRIWDAATKTERARSDVGRAGWVNAVATAPDGSWLATGSLDRGAQIWDSATGMERMAFARHDVTWRPDALVSGWGAPGRLWRTVRAWITAARELRTMLVARRSEDRVTTVAVAPDGTWLAAGGLDGTVRIWVVSNGRQRATFTGHAGPVMAMAVAPDGSWLAIAFSDGMVRIWDLATGKEQAILPGHGDWVTAIAVAPDGGWLAAASSDGTVSVWDVAAGRSRTKLIEHAIWADAVAALPNGGSLVTSGLDPRVRIWDVATGDERLALSGHSTAVAGIAVAPDGSWLATAGGDPEVLVWDLASGSKRAVLAGHGAWTAAVAVAPDGGWLATGGYDGMVRMWDVATGKERAAFSAQRVRGRAAEVASGRWLTIRGYGRIEFQDPVTGDERSMLIRGHGTGTYAIAISPDGTWLAVTGIDPVVQLWDIPTGNRRLALTGHHNEVYTAVAAPDGSWLATGGRDGTVRIWDVAAGRQRAVLTGHRDTVYTVAAAPDGRWLASGGSDGTVRIWDTARWQAQTLMRVDGQIFTCAWLGANRIACGGQAGLYVFDFLGGTDLLPAPSTGPAGIAGHQSEQA